tara:strand:- start:224 stop:424 length:201 start_codon:yes stop_codon:yes gene_type:complete
MNSETINNWRIIPRLAFTLYLTLWFKSSIWFMGLTIPTSEQSAFIAVVWGASAVWFGFYVNSGGKK